MLLSTKYSRFIVVVVSVEEIGGSRKDEEAEEVSLFITCHIDVVNCDIFLILVCTMQGGKVVSLRVDAWRSNLEKDLRHETRALRLRSFDR